MHRDKSFLTFGGEQKQANTENILLPVDVRGLITSRVLKFPTLSSKVFGRSNFELTYICERMNHPNIMMSRGFFHDDQ